MAPSDLKKRIVVCCDGTWMDSDGDYQTPSNVTRIARAIPPLGTDQSVTPHRPIPQIVFYQNGIGTGSNSLYDKYVGGATGEGLAGHIREAYSFICLNYNPGDEIFLIGFSRGAFTARSISSLINAAGLLTAKGLEYFVQVFEDWEFQLKKDFKTKWPNLPFVGHKPPVTDPHYQQQLIEKELTRPNIKIKCVAVWDTVGGLGIPMIGLLPQPPSKDFAFVDTRVESNIEYAFQALALDEHRRSFSPTVWDWPRVEPNDLKVLKQTWFPGVHSDIGGSYDDTALANLTLAWMVSLLDPILTINQGYIMDLIKPQETLSQGHQTFTRDGRMRTSTNTQPHLRPWGLGKIHNSMTFFFKLGGSRIRTPGEYREEELASQHGTLLWILWKLSHRVTRLFGHQGYILPRLARTNETIHSSVRIRMGKDGLGYNDKGKYDSQALQGWVMHGMETNPDTPIALGAPGPVGKMKNVVWKKAIYPEKLIGGKVKIVQTKGKTETIQLEEEPLGVFERQILQLWPEIQRDFDTIVPGRHDQQVNKASTYPLGGYVDEPADTNGNGLKLDTGKRRSETA
ncbi:uncharacterized protein Z518_02650 [Rhinocladiella mackenziei CBS 650.93]|uniref:T6SS Phospholipase effector Tle1-like catalytic domain-containing protein n=1 Tax=Rhinocladiella mackenziei CBS 650.93 TaxID=1442369 RepID=A0A0D2IXE8_9EURO|nr:uncharacterized protein Z518_02650 [Rhinocladiella mackenziei CBS 650.93]KIX07996.1 hypothetical protein Z518_02650 [Rhinocladiella mackenziei CBS 650.93]